jgi:hypothetical protein
VPWRRDDYDGALTRVAGQDLSALSEVADYLSPMTYSFMLYRPPEWIPSVIQDFDWISDCPILPSIQVSRAYREDEVFSTADFEAALRVALEPPSAGVVFWSWDHIEADAERAETIRRVVGGWNGGLRNSRTLEGLGFQPYVNLSLQTALTPLDNLPLCSPGTLRRTPGSRPDR